MAKERENQALREYSNRKKRYKRIRNIAICVLFVAVALIGVCYVTYRNNKSYKSYKVINTTELTGDNAAGYLSYGSSLIRYNKDGAAIYDRSGTTLLKASYEMSNPIADTCGKYVAIADRGGKSIRVYNGEKEVGSYSTEYDITKIKVASQGVVAALMQEGDRIYFKLYRLDGKELGVSAKTINNAGYPLDIALSEDGTKVVIIYLSVASGDMISNVVCYNFDDVGANSNDQCVGIFKSDKGIVAPEVEFLNNDTFCIYKDNGFELYSMKEKPSNISEVKLKGKIQSVFNNKNNVGIVLEAEDGSSKHIMLYNLKGKLILNKAFDFEYTKISMTNKEIILYSELSCMIMKMNGKVKFRYNFDKNITGLYPNNDLDHYYLINDTNLMDIQLTD